jgi:hypothetical protein
MLLMRVMRRAAPTLLPRSRLTSLKTLGLKDWTASLRDRQMKVEWQLPPAI